RQAHSLNLVDQLGGLQASIDQLAHKAGIMGTPKIIQEHPRVGLLDWILKATISQPLVNYPPTPSLQYTCHFNGWQ
ncbi:MAG: signal peptide peptidase SppA, partial [Nitrospinales bacterium]|nr:signal peptide peptidase SppA [Nitrospinales bacterium]